MLWPSALVVLLAGCGAEVVVESNTSWMGDVCGAEYCAAEYTDHDFVVLVISRSHSPHKVATGFVIGLAIQPILDM